MTAKIMHLPRKPVRGVVHVTLDDCVMLTARTLSVSSHGLTMMSPAPIRRGVLCKIAFGLALDGESRQVQALVRSLDSICVGMEGFRTGMQFIELDERSRNTIRTLMAA